MEIIGKKVRKRVTEITKALNNLNEKDIYSLMMFTLFQLKDDPKYSTLSELCYILDNKNFNKFLAYYGGMTITIPTLRDMRKVTQALLLYQYVNIEENDDFDTAVKAVCADEFSIEEITETYQTLLDVISKFSFGLKE